jgi:hypothetical protein
MQFLLLLPELPRAYDGGFLDRAVNVGRPSIFYHCRTLVLSAVDVAWRQLAGGRRRIDLVNARLS